jgi:hypothetical protein
MSETLAQQMKRLKLRFKDIINRPLVLLREIKTRGGKVTEKGAITVAYGHHYGTLTCDCASRVSKTDVALADPDAIDKRLNLADAVRKRSPEWFKGRDLRMIKTGIVVTIHDVNTDYFCKRVYSFGAVYEGEYLSIHLDDAELAELPEDTK